VAPDLHNDLHPDTPDSYALRRRVLLTAVLTLGVFFVLGYAITALEAPPWLLLPAMLLVVLMVVRPLMAPVLAANRLQRRFAMQAYREQKQDGRG